jgi:putative colanic acid biosynthesis acetyltransferase WcaF
MKNKPEHSSGTVELRGYSSHFGLGLRLGRALWGLAWLVLFRPSPFPFHGWRRTLLRLFGAKIGPGVHVYPSVLVWAPWNLTMAEGSSLGPWVDCYCVDKIELGAWAVVSQRSFLCAATHDIRSTRFQLITAPIVIGEKAWVAAEAFISPGIKVGEGGVVAARACVVKDVKPWTVVGGNPAKVIGHRRIKAGEKS